MQKIPKTEKLVLNVHGMHCAGCVATVEKGLGKHSGVLSAQVNLVTGSANVLIDSTQTTQNAIIETIKNLGYSATIGQADIIESNESEVRSARSRLILSILFAVPLMIMAMGPMILTDHQPLISHVWDAILQGILAALVLFVAGRLILIDAFKQCLRAHANMNSLIALGTLTAFFWSIYGTFKIWSGEHEALYFDSAGMIIALILTGRYLEARAKGKAGEAIKSLLNLRPAKAMAVFNNVEFEVDTVSVRPGMFLVVRPNERIAADGLITEGQIVINESMLTGESLPVEKNVGDVVIGGSLNGNRPFRMKVTAAGENSYLATVIRMVSEAQGRKAPIQNLADKVAGIFVPIMLGIALLTLIGWTILAPGHPLAMKSVIAVLIIACPCALGLATPTAVLAGTGRAAKAGILIRGGDILEKLSKVDTVIFDKTGTLTYGKLKVVNLVVNDENRYQTILGILFALEKQSDHPIAKAITSHLRNLNITPMTVTQIESKPGFGMTGMWESKSVLIGSKTFLENNGLHGKVFEKELSDESAKGHTVLFCAIENEIVGFASFEDVPRDDAKDIVTFLKDSGKRVVLLSGDNQNTAQNTARQIGIDEVSGNVKPEEKKSFVDSYHQQNQTVAMVGDGINDAPALAAADVGIAVGGGTDIAIESADVVLARSDLNLLRQMFVLSHASLRVIKQNLFWAFFYNLLAIPIAAGVLYPLTGWTLSPMIAAATMSFSSVFVVFNSLRLNRWKLN
jgi:P-type Cu+ transporter